MSEIKGRLHLLSLAVICLDQYQGVDLIDTVLGIVDKAKQAAISPESDIIEEAEADAQRALELAEETFSPNYN